MQDVVKDGSLTIPQNNIIGEDLFYFQLFFVFAIFERNVLGSGNWFLAVQDSSIGDLVTQ